MPANSAAPRVTARGLGEPGSCSVGPVPRRPWKCHLPTHVPSLSPLEASGFAAPAARAAALRARLHSVVASEAEKAKELIPSGECGGGEAGRSEIGPQA